MTENGKGYRLPGSTPEAPYAYTASGAIRARATTAQAALLERMNISLEDYGGTGTAPRRMEPAAAAAATDRLSAARERAAAIREMKRALLEKNYGPDYREKGHKISDVSIEEALSGALEVAQSSGDAEAARELERQVGREAVRRRVSRQASRNAASSSRGPAWADALGESVKALAGRLASMEAVGKDTAATAREAAGLVRQNSLERRQAVEAAKRVREAREAQEEAARKKAVLEAQAAEAAEAAARKKEAAKPPPAPAPSKPAPPAPEPAPARAPPPEKPRQFGASLW